MALTENIYNPKGIALSNPMGTKDLFPNKTITPGTAGDLNTTSVLFPTINDNPLGYDDIQTLNAKYSFDLGSVTADYHKENYPFQWISDVNAKNSSLGDIHIQAEDRDRDIDFHDSMLNKLRIVSQGSNGSPLAFDDPNNLGGKLIWKKLTTANFGDITKLVAAAVNGTNETTIASPLVAKNTNAYDTVMWKPSIAGSSCNGNMVLPLAWALSSSGETSRSAGGLDAQVFIAKLAALLEGNWYKRAGYDTHVIQTTGSGQRLFGYVHEKTAGVNKVVCTIHSMFEDFCIKINGSERQLNEVNARLYGAFWTADYKELVLLIDFNYSNLEVPLASVASSNVVLIEEFKDDSTEFSGGYTRLSSHLLLNQFASVPDAIAQGSDLGGDNNLHSGYLYDVEAKQNFCQIIQSPKIKITGTYLASQNRMKINQPQKMRDDMMKKFKQMRTNMALYGSGASRKRNSDGDIVNTSAGFFCYQQNPIRYRRQTLNFNAAQSKMEAIKQFINNYARSVFAFSPSMQNTGVKTVMVSKHTAIMIDDYIKFGMQEQMNAYGMNVGMQPMISGNSVDMDIRYTKITTPYGTLEFIVDPALDYLTELRLPSFVSATKVNPKLVMMAVDKSKISTVVLRAPRLRGNIQTNSADFTMEDILCEETLEVLDPMSHSITLVNIPE